MEIIQNLKMASKMQIFYMGLNQSGKNESK